MTNIVLGAKRRRQQLPEMVDDLDLTTGVEEAEHRANASREKSDRFNQLVEAVTGNEHALNHTGTLAFSSRPSHFFLQKVPGGWMRSVALRSPRANECLVEFHNCAPPRDWFRDAFRCSFLLLFEGAVTCRRALGLIL